MLRIIVFGLFLHSIPAAHAGSAGREPFNFLFLDANARAVGMSGAYTALASDPNALLYNPAGLGKVKGYQATLMHNQYFQGITQEYLAYASPRGWGASFNYLSFGEIRNTTLSNKTGIGLGTFGLTTMALTGGYGRPIFENLTVGVGLKFLREVIDDVSGQGVALDMGLGYSVPMVQGLSIGAALQNLGPSVKFQSSKEDLPLAFRVGTAYVFDFFKRENVLALDLVKARNESALVAFGVETILGESFPVRVGYNTRNDAGPGITAGLGYVHKDISFDYAFAPFKELGDAHRFSLSFRWGNAVLAKAKAVKDDIVLSTTQQENTELVRVMEEVRQAFGVEVFESAETKGTSITASEKAIYFDNGSSRIQEAVHPLLDTIGELILAMNSEKVDVLGYTDNVGTPETNAGLSNDRAAAVVDYFSSKKGLDRKIFSSLGRGSENPIASNSTAEGRSRNRRVEIVIYR